MQSGSLLSELTGEVIMKEWKTPRLDVRACGMEVNMYAPAEEDDGFVLFNTDKRGSGKPARSDAKS